MATEAGLRLCAPIHDAVLLEAPLERLNEDIARLRAIMGEVSKIVLNGFEVRTDVEVVRWPDRYMDERGEVMWERVMRLLGELEMEAQPYILAWVGGGRGNCQRRIRLTNHVYSSV